MNRSPHIGSLDTSNSYFDFIVYYQVSLKSLDQFETSYAQSCSIGMNLFPNENSSTNSDCTSFQSSHVHDGSRDFLVRFWNHETKNFDEDLNFAEFIESAPHFDDQNFLN